MNFLNHIERGCGFYVSFTSFLLYSVQFTHYINWKVRLKIKKSQCKVVEVSLNSTEKNSYSKTFVWISSKNSASDLFSVSALPSTVFYSLER